MTQQVYVIRQVAYRYSDEFFYVHTLGGIHAVYTDYDAALRDLHALECAAFRHADFSTLEAFSPCGDGRSHHQRRAALDRYLQEQCGTSFFIRDDGHLYADDDAYLPAGITDAQIMQIREITGVTFYELGAFESAVVFYGLWLTREGRFYQVDAGTLGAADYFFNTYDQALAAANTLLADALWGTVLHGTVEELSEQPALLRSLLAQHQTLTYDPALPGLTLRHLAHDGALLMLNALLRQPLFEVRTIPLDVARTFRHILFEVM
ncbi:MAG: hypothetical protein HGA65_14320 [Oscillochloris sp.]|nr:hypothetical protein [Oscillochloris sp.]